ncbi:hypothetical protein [Paenibacillus marinisediminis]
MEDAIDYKLFRKELVEYYTKVLENFSASEDNYNVYALVLESDVGNSDVHIYWNNLNELDYVMKERYADTKHTVHGIKYSIGDFMHVDDCIGVDESRVWELCLQFDKYTGALCDGPNYSDELYDYHCERFTMTLIDVLKDLEPVIKLLNKTDDFIAFVTDRGYEDPLKHAKETIPDEIYSKVYKDLIRSYI